jgi:hypothetical protein
MELAGLEPAISFESLYRGVVALTREQVLTDSTIRLLLQREGGSRAPRSCLSRMRESDEGRLADPRNGYPKSSPKGRLQVRAEH